MFVFDAVIRLFWLILTDAFWNHSLRRFHSDACDPSRKNVFATKPVKVVTRPEAKNHARSFLMGPPIEPSTSYASFVALVALTPRLRRLSSRLVDRKACLLAMTSALILLPPDFVTVLMATPP